MVVADGYEGVILRAPHAPYKFGRSTVREGYLLKVKRFQDSEAQIIGYEEEMHNGNEATINALGYTERSSHAENRTGKGTLGALVVRDLVTKVEFKIGTGFTPAERLKIWALRHEHLDDVVKYRFFPVGVKDKPRHPSFLGFRPEGA
jgi:DNA ligase-1